VEAGGVAEVLAAGGAHEPTAVTLDHLGEEEAAAAHDRTRLLCLELVRTCVEDGPADGAGPEALVGLYRDDLVLSLLTLGQSGSDGPAPLLGGGPPAPGAPNRKGAAAASPPVLTSVLSTASLLFHHPWCRPRLAVQVEAMLNGLHARALALLAERCHGAPDVAGPTVTDAEAGAFLEGLVDVLRSGVDAASPLAAHAAQLSPFESLFVTYDCAEGRSDVATDLARGVCRCLSASANQAMVDGGDDDNDDGKGAQPMAMLGKGLQMAGSPLSRHTSSEVLPPSSPFWWTGEGGVEEGSEAQFHRRHLPFHLKELCVEVLRGCLSSLLAEENDGNGKFTRTPPPSNTDGPTAPPSMRATRRLKRTFRKAASLFNDKPATGIKYLQSAGTMPACTPSAVAHFLRDGLSFGLDKAAIGAYLGEAGKGAAPLRSPHESERDWFHREVLVEYCGTFHFKGQALLDGLRMFLSSFRLPGEAQQIDRIVQAFAESCAAQCREATSDGVFSDDPKRAADCAYLLSFSIIMLNTDQHNDNIRADRKMTSNDFFKNNTNYGRDITEEGRELSREYLGGIFDLIRREPIRTEGEGASGVMTAERWKDVLRRDDDGDAAAVPPCDLAAQRADVRSMMLDVLCPPTYAAICGLWGEEGRVGAHELRMGMQLASDLLGACHGTGRVETFREVYTGMAMFTGLLVEEPGTAPARDVTSILKSRRSFVYSERRQSAFIVAMQTAKEAGDMLGQGGWRYVWNMMMELRDLKLLSREILAESDADLLTEVGRLEWTDRILGEATKTKGEFGGTSATGEVDQRPEFFEEEQDGRRLSGGVFRAVGRMLFGEDTDEDEARAGPARCKYGKDAHIVWNDTSVPSVEEEDVAATSTLQVDDGTNFGYDHLYFGEGGKMRNNTSTSFLSQQAKVRKHLSKTCDFRSLIFESRLLSLDGLKDMLTSLMELTRANSVPLSVMDENGEEMSIEFIEREDDGSLRISPASEAFAEVLICEIVLKNRDRISTVWDLLEKHYVGRLSSKGNDDGSGDGSSELYTCSPGIEKCATGLLRICYHVLHREDVMDQVLGTLVVLHPPTGLASCLELDKHVGEGIWRICSRNVDELAVVNAGGWDGLLGLIKWCATRGGKTMAVHRAGLKEAPGLAEDDPALFAFRSLHLLVHSSGLRGRLPPQAAAGCIRELIQCAGEGKSAELGVAGLDLLLVLHTRIEVDVGDCGDGNSWADLWFQLVGGMADAAGNSAFPNVRRHALEMICDVVVDKRATYLSDDQLRAVVGSACIPLACTCINTTFDDLVETDEVHHGLELCIALIFKPMLHHVKRIASDGSFETIWKSVLKAMEGLLGKEAKASDGSRDVSEEFLTSVKGVGSQQLCNALVVLSAAGIISADNGGGADGVSSLTWSAINNMTFLKNQIDDWVKMSRSISDSGDDFGEGTANSPSIPPT